MMDLFFLIFLCLKNKNTFYKIATKENMPNIMDTNIVTIAVNKKIYQGYPGASSKHAGNLSDYSISLRYVELNVPSKP